MDTQAWGALGMIGFATLIALFGYLGMKRVLGDQRDGSEIGGDMWE